MEQKLMALQKQFEQLQQQIMCPDAAASPGSSRPVSGISTTSNASGMSSTTPTLRQLECDPKAVSTYIIPLSAAKDIEPALDSPKMASEELVVVEIYPEKAQKVKSTDYPHAAETVKFTEPEVTATIEPVSPARAQQQQPSPTNKSPIIGQHPHEDSSKSPSRLAGAADESSSDVSPTATLLRTRARLRPVMTGPKMTSTLFGGDGRKVSLTSDDEVPAIPHEAWKHVAGADSDRDVTRFRDRADSNPSVSSLRRHENEDFTRRELPLDTVIACANTSPVDTSRENNSTKRSSNVNTDNGYPAPVSDNQATEPITDIGYPAPVSDNQATEPTSSNDGYPAPVSDNQAIEPISSPILPMNQAEEEQLLAKEVLMTSQLQSQRQYFKPEKGNSEAVIADDEPQFAVPYTEPEVATDPHSSALDTDQSPIRSSQDNGQFRRISPISPLKDSKSPLGLKSPPPLRLGPQPASEAFGRKPVSSVSISRIINDVLGQPNNRDHGSSQNNSAATSDYPQPTAQPMASEDYLQPSAPPMPSADVSSPPPGTVPLPEENLTYPVDMAEFKTPYNDQPPVSTPSMPNPNVALPESPLVAPDLDYIPETQTAAHSSLPPPAPSKEEIENIDRSEDGRQRSQLHLLQKSSSQDELWTARQGSSDLPLPRLAKGERSPAESNSSYVMSAALKKDMRGQRGT